VPGVKLSVEGKILFDVKNGAPREIEMKGTFVRTSNTGNVRVPLLVTYKLLQGAERERILNPPPPPPPPESKPIEGDQLALLIEDLNGENKDRRNAAVKALANAKPTDARRAEVAKALAPLLTEIDLNIFVRRDVAKALGIWGTKESVDALLPILEDTDAFMRAETIKALGKLKDERAIEPMAKRLTDGFDRMVLKDTLKVFGSKAEKAVAGYLKHTDWVVRMEACNILKEIGTKASRAALLKASRDSNGLVKQRAKEALQVIGTRK
jgi:HEAT repeat protein